jgi:LysR family glycine cleavage system transcriptional activator
LPSIVSHVSG